MARRNGLVEENGKVYFYVNGLRQIGWVQLNANNWYYFDNTGAWTGIHGAHGLEEPQSYFDGTDTWHWNGKRWFHIPKR
ncbi:hypothetical protein HPT25_17320 [Bacillus sp. BRMEA1]|uniref:hypothetical protein n=1 Tax=Neobacillus endophyticus TaxID=2738405 RepID=UPI0015673C47|nr:hypothetical protein [Neobacillus endophyticus]NRD79121.1 hypothetical protein [Neobacillus endophyticus]